VSRSLRVGRNRETMSDQRLKSPSAT
jgi:hypothetical protein